MQCTGDSSSYEITKLCGADVSGRASTSDDNQLPFADQPRPSTSRGSAEESGGVPGLSRSSVVAASPAPCGSRRRSSSPAAWPPRPGSMSLSANEMDSDDDDEARPSTYSSQGVESLDDRRDEMPSLTDDSRGKQPAAKSRGLGVNMAAKNRHRPASVVTSSVTSEAADCVEATASH